MRLHLRLPGTVAGSVGLHSGWLCFRPMPKPRQLPERKVPLHPRLREHSGVHRNNFLGSTAIGQINPAYPFADNFAPDGVGGNVPLADFFPIPQNQPRQFQKIILPPTWQSYDANYFLNYNGPTMDPDNDAIDND
jgi:hypothetical protein